MKRKPRRMKAHTIDDDPETLGIEKGHPIPKEVTLAYVHPAKQTAVTTILSRPVDDDGRSEWVWLRLPNGDLILGVFPRGDTYFEFERDAQYPSNPK